MRKFFRFLSNILPLLLIAGAVGGYFYYAKINAPCFSPVTYRVGTFDTRFGVSEANFLEAAKEAAAVWNTAAGKKLLVYDENGAVPINLIYDAREATTQKNQTLQTSISADKSVASSVRQRYSALKTKYNADQTAYETALASYNKDLSAYNQEVDYWNTKGGAPQSEYQKLNSEKAALDSSRALLESKRENLNAEARDINSLIDEYNLVVDHVNSTVDKVNVNAGREFEEGEFISDVSGKRINIYEFENEQKLVRVLAHELGHALGLEHNDGPQSIMYYLNQSTNIAPSKEDVASLQALCKAK